MILTCPACATRYRVADQEFEGSNGRTVHCANCGHLWYQTHPMRPASDPGEAVANGPAASDPAIDEPRTIPALGSAPGLEISPNRAPSPPRARSLASGIATIILLFVVAVIAAFVIHRHWATDRLPAAHPQVTLNQPTAPAGAGLAIRNVTPARSADGLVVDGEIVNSGNVTRDVPRLRVALQDSAEKEVQSKTVDPPKARLQPGEVAHFEAPFAHPPDAATGVVVTFASS